MTICFTSICKGNIAKQTTLDVYKYSQSSYHFVLHNQEKLAYIINEILGMMSDSMRLNFPHIMYLDST